jgi:hypothetical protein
MTNLRRRLRRLEDSNTPSTVRKVWQIITINSDGTKKPTEFTIEWPSTLNAQNANRFLNECCRSI